MDLYRRLVENIEHNLSVMVNSNGIQAKRICVQRARGVWDFGQYLIRCGELVLDETQSDNYWSLDKIIFDADHGLDSK